MGAGVSVVVTFNIDKLILNAFAKVQHMAVDFATAKEPVKYRNFPVSENKFVFFPHGEIGNPHSWVFTDSERRELYRDAKFKEIMSALLNGKNLLILGFNPEEYNFLTLLNQISLEGGRVSGYDNYYIGPNLQKDVIDDLAGYGITCIPYQPSDEMHPEIEETLKELLTYVPRDREYPTVYEGAYYTEADIPSYQDCYKLGIDELRKRLNGVIAGIIPRDKIPTDEDLRRLQDFYRKYAPQLHSAWFINPDSEEGNHVHGYALGRSVGRGAFGNVYEAHDKEGNKYALKVLLPEVKDKVQYLSCFRRGIRAMQILTRHKIEGMVKIHSSYEVPACIIMDYVEGVTLRTAIDDKRLHSADKKLELLYSIAQIIYKAHNLEECILHRDLKPENIMLKDFYYENTNDEILVSILDFDLSWHKGATELTVALGAMSQGFMAPELAEEVVNLTRNTAVDVYSLGMIAYYVMTGENPAPYQHRFEHFREDMVKALTGYKFTWKYLPEFLADTIIKATYHEQKKRVPLAAYIANIRLAKAMVISEELPNTHPLLLQELACMVNLDDRVESREFGREVVLETEALGKKVVLKLDQDHRDGNPILNVEISKIRQGSESRDRVAKYLESAKSKALAAVDRKLFYHSYGEIKMSEVVIRLSARLPEPVSHGYLKAVSDNIAAVRSQLFLG